MDAEQERAAAQLRADAARAKLTHTLVSLQARVNPRALARDAIDELRDVGSDLAQTVMTAAKRNPAPLIGIGATIIALLARDWLTDAFAKIIPSATPADPPRSTPDRYATNEKGRSDD